MGVDAGATRSSAEVEEHRRNRRAVGDAGATRSLAVDVVAIHSSEVEEHRRNRRAVVVAVATHSLVVVEQEQERATDLRVVAQGGVAETRLVVMADRAARHRWIARAVRQVAVRWPVAAERVGARARAQRAEAVEA